MEEEDSVQLNISIEPVYKTKTRRKLQRKDRLKGKKRVIIDSTSEEDEHQESTTEHEGDLSHGQDCKHGLKRKHEGPAAGGPGGDGVKKKKFSSLFRNNPEIPVVQSASGIDHVTETVFSNKKFDKLGLHPFMVSNLEERLGFKQMTTVQQHSIPHILQDKDVLIKSQTGSGKTVSYAVPIIQHLQGIRPKICRAHGPYAIVIVPTRELAIQTFSTMQKLVQPFTWVVPGCLMGGEKRKAEKARLRKGINVLVATPGRLVDHLKNTESLSVDRVSWLVIDEADRLLELGFEKVVSEVLTVLQEKSQCKRQTVLLSATLSAGVERLAGMSLQDAVKVDITKNQEEADFAACSDDKQDKFAMPEKLRHHLVVVPHKLRLVTLAAFIVDKCRFSTSRSKMVVFLATQDSVDFHYTLFQNTLLGSHGEDEDSDDEDAVDLFRLHGDMLQKERSRVFLEYAGAKSGILLCTDVAARGLDLPHVDWIVQYNSPGSATDYIHRVGRTARIGTRGQALLFLAPSEVEYVKMLNSNGISLVDLPVSDILQILILEYSQLSRKEKQRSDAPHTAQEAATRLQIRFEVFVQDNKDSRTLARKAYQSYVRAYTTFPSSLKHIFHIKNLHLGHLAKSFGLQDSPTHIGSFIGNHTHHKTKKAKSERNAVKKRKPGLSIKERMRQAVISEYSSGFDGVNLHKSTHKKKRLGKKSKN